MVLGLSMRPVCSNYLPKQKPFTRHPSSNLIIIKRGCIKRPLISPSAAAFGGDGIGLRVFVLSDLHTDYSENMTWVKSISTVKYKNDVLLVAGDVSETYKTFVLTMSLLKDRFEHVFFVPGNHDLWCRWKGEEHVSNLK